MRERETESWCDEKFAERASDFGALRAFLTSDLFVQIAAKEDGQAFDPLVHVDVAVVVAVEGAEHAVHQDVVGHVERVVEDVAELEPVHAVHVLGDGLEDIYERFDLRLAD